MKKVLIISGYVILTLAILGAWFGHTNTKTKIVVHTETETKYMNIVPQDCKDAIAAAEQTFTLIGQYLQSSDLTQPTDDIKAQLSKFSAEKKGCN